MGAAPVATAAAFHRAVRVTATIAIAAAAAAGRAAQAGGDIAAGVRRTGAGAGVHRTGVVQAMATAATTAGVVRTAHSTTTMAERADEAEGNVAGVAALPAHGATTVPMITGTKSIVVLVPAITGLVLTERCRRNAARKAAACY